MNQNNQPPSRAEMILRYGVALSILIVALGVLAYVGVQGVISAIVTDPKQAQAMTSLLCVGGVVVVGLVGLIVGASHLMANRNLAMAYQSEGTRAMLMSTAREKDADADLKRAAFAVLSNGQPAATSRMATYQPPQAQLPEPQVITVPRYTNQGQAKPFNGPVLRTTTQDDEGNDSDPVEVPLKFLMRFAGLDTPARSEWVGDRGIYSECVKFFVSHGMLEKQSNNGYRWADAYPIETRRAWLMQFDEAT